ncbi:EF-hand domain-containing protein [Neogemmobacter tilapiae]|uniref:EF-hand domain-containing protein n=1 Tax=Neogemmobacter tilapiae TaxID=875041 RepID=A0A918TPD7_9RHOB|nr:EF-hand domain-containing protein [Gemmobacter tilapiae]GHC56318.1 hypothetical protein GCM10007315_19540 [Gemmobacter tilapiae]
MTRIGMISAMMGSVLGLAASTAFAQELPAIADADGNGTWSLAELQTVFPDLTEEAFTSIDANADAGVDQAELTAAVSDGAITVPAQ